MYKIALIADNHFWGRERLGVMEGGMDSRLADKLRSLSTAMEYCIDHEVDLVCHLGDCFDRPNPGDRVKAAVSEVIGKYLDAGGNLLAIVGNHERVGAVSPWHSEAFLAPRLVVKSAPEMYAVEDCGPGILCLPEAKDSYDPEVVKEVLTGTDRPFLVIGHGAVAGTFATETYKFDHGWSPEFLENLGAPVALFGHFHKRQIYANEKFKYGYVGCMNRQDFGEKDYETGFVVLTYEGSRYELPEAEWIDIPDRPMLQFDFEEGAPVIKPLRLPVEAPLVKVTLKGAPAWIHSNEVQEVVQYLTDNSLKCVVDYMIVKEAHSMSLATRGFSVGAAFDTYVEENKVTKVQIALGKEILEEVQKVDE